MTNWKALISIKRGGLHVKVMITEFVGTYMCPACERFLRNRLELAGANGEEGL